MLNKEERGALRTRLGAMTAMTDEATGSAGTDTEVAPMVKEWVSALLDHADAADVEIARLTAALERETSLRERAENGMSFYESGEWVI